MPSHIETTVEDDNNRLNRLQEDHHQGDLRLCSAELLFALCSTLPPSPTSPTSHQPTPLNISMSLHHNQHRTFLACPVTIIILATSTLAWGATVVDLDLHRGQPDGHQRIFLHLVWSSQGVAVPHSPQQEDLHFDHRTSQEGTTINLEAL